MAPRGARMSVVSDRRGGADRSRCLDLAPPTSQAPTAHGPSLLTTDILAPSGAISGVFALSSSGRDSHLTVSLSFRP